NSPSEPSGRAIRPLPRVVPMLAPMITLMAGRRAITPALTRPTVITVMAVEDWMMPVISVPASTPLAGVPAILASHWRILLTDSAWMPLAMNSRPSMNTPRPPITGTRISLNRSTCDYRIDTVRHVQAGPLGQRLDSTTDADASTLHIEAAWHAQVGSASVQPYLSMSGSRLKTDCTRERGGSTALSIEGTRDELLMTTAALR